MDVFKTMELARLLGWTEVYVNEQIGGEPYVTGVGPGLTGIHAPVPDYFSDVTQAVALMVRYGVNVGFDEKIIWACRDYPDGAQEYTEADKGFHGKSDEELTAFCIATITLQALKHEQAQH